MNRCLALTISTLLLLSLAGTASATLIAQWKLDDGGGTVAKDSVGKVDGTLVGAAAWVTGKKDGALQFNGTNAAVDLGTSDIFKPAGSFSISLWANIGAWSTEWDHSPIGNQEDGTGWCIRRFGSWWSSQNAAVWTQPANALCFTTRGIMNNGIEDTPSKDVPPLNEWVHIVCVYDSANNMKYIYFNGVEEAAMGTTGTLTQTTSKTYIGAIANTTNTGILNPFTGMLDDVRLYNNALVASDVQKILQGTDAPTASQPVPADKATDVYREAVLSWTPSPSAIGHDVYFGTNFDDVNKATRAAPAGLLLSQEQTAASFTPGRLELGKTYYWRVDEVNDVVVPSVWPGEVWSFTTAAYVVVDDFESYRNTSPDRPFQTWIDGLGFTEPQPGKPGNNTGAVLGHGVSGGSIMETTIVNSGQQSLPLYYDNSGAGGHLNYSQIDRTFAKAQDWTQFGITRLVVHFYGSLANTGQLYVKINNTKISYPGSAADIATEAWTPWEIDLTSRAALVRSVSTLSIGIDGSGASGLLYVDDIRLE
jgi:hypothetical protein